MNKNDQEAMGMVSIWVMIILIAMAFIATDAKGSPPLGEAMVPGEWNQETHLWTSRSLVGEAGWKSVDDHVAIMNILRRRWQRLEAKVPILPSCLLGTKARLLVPRVFSFTKIG